MFFFHVKCPSFLSDVIKLEFSPQIFGKYTTNFMEIRSAGALRIDGKTRGS